MLHPRSWNFRIRKVDESKSNFFLYFYEWAVWATGRLHPLPSVRWSTNRNRFPLYWALEPTYCKKKYPVKWSQHIRGFCLFPNPYIHIELISVLRTHYCVLSECRDADDFFVISSPESIAFICTWSTDTLKWVIPLFTSWKKMKKVLSYIIGHLAAVFLLFSLVNSFFVHCCVIFSTSENLWVFDFCNLYTNCCYLYRYITSSRSRLLWNSAFNGRFSRKAVWK